MNSGINISQSEGPCEGAVLGCLWLGSGEIAAMAVLICILCMSALLATLANPAIYSVKSQEEGKNYIALTFDDGPHATLTPRLLDALKAKEAKATFFVMGVKVLKHKTILERAVAEGHEIANHFSLNLYGIIL